MERIIKKTLGHDEELTLLLNSFNNNEMSKTWLIAGPKGIGKASLINDVIEYILAKDNILNIRERLLSLSLPDVKIINKDNDNITIDEIRDLINFAHLTSIESTQRIAIIDCADNMNINASNALLKLLEEPPRNFIFFLISHSPHKLLPTIRSRCALLRINTPVKEVSLEILRLNIKDASENYLSTILYLSEGSPGEALNLHNNNGVEIYKEFLDVLNTKKSSRIHSFSVEEDKWNIFTFLVRALLYRATKRSIGIELMYEVVPEETILIDNLKSKLSIEQLLEL
jgi:DNA polymerase-3 subunit delta'